MKDKIPFYNIANMFFVGCISVVAIGLLEFNNIPMDQVKDLGQKLSEWTAFITLLITAVMFEIGFIINRLSSITIEPIFIKIRLWPREQYSLDVSELSQTNAKFQALITELNLMRSHIMIFSIIMIIALIQCKWYFAFATFFLVVIFAIGGRKHNAKINIIREGYATRLNKGDVQ